MDWGNGSDIVAAASGGLSAIGSIFAIGLTGWLAVRERKRAEQLAEQAVHVDAARRYEVVQAARQIIERIAFLHNRYAENGESRSYTFDGSYEGYRRDINAQCDRLLSLKSFGGSNPSLSIALENIATMHRVPEGDQPTYTMRLMRVISKTGAANYQAEDIERFI